MVMIDCEILVVVGAGEEPVGPQNWYKEAGGQPAEALPREDVGPHLPPGGELLLLSTHVHVP